MEVKEKISRLVVKVGTSTLTHDSGQINFHAMDRLARVLSDIKNTGCEVILVSSGAISVGVSKLRMESRPEALRLKQAAAAVGQCEMMHLYDKSFGEYGQTVGQILLTREDVHHPQRKENLINTFNALLELGAIPIVNENDSVSSAEIEEGAAKIFGDNDTLSAVVAVLCGADTLVLFTDIDGLFECDPHKDASAEKICEVNEITEELRGCAGGAGTNRGTGGMCTKLDAAQIVMDAGIDMIITSGSNPENLYSIIAGDRVGTLFRKKKEAAK